MHRKPSETIQTKQSAVRIKNMNTLTRFVLSFFLVALLVVSSGDVVAQQRNEIKAADIFGAAIGLASQDVLKSPLGTVTLLGDKPCRGAIE